jgi:addiction module HigA family antidote
MRTVDPVSPGEMLEEEFLKPLGLTKYRLAKDIGVPPQRIGDIVAGKRAITADTDLRLCRYFGLSDGWWLRGQAQYDMEVGKYPALWIARRLTGFEQVKLRMRPPALR